MPASPLAVKWPARVGEVMTVERIVHETVRDFYEGVRSAQPVPSGTVRLRLRASNRASG